MAVQSGELAGSVTTVRFPDISGSRCVIQGAPTNTGRVYIGGAGVTVPNGTGDTTSGIALAAGIMLPLVIRNLNELYYICDGAGDEVLYFMLD